ncbi:MAG: hypothetical protein KF718_31585 [Polyangiaceae bacterium]|nr:hypothetical protein [Polyangiaceae bacterium]
MRVALLSLVLCGMACSSGGSGGGGGGGSGARTDVCLAWQDAACDHFADQCATFSRAECDDFFQSLYCKSDSVMQACMDALPGASCTSLPVACENVADPQPAVNWCTDFIGRYCDRAAACGLASLAECVNAVQSSLNCSLAVGIGPSSGQCHSDLAAASCAQIESSLPSSCSGVIKLND